MSESAYREPGELPPEPPEPKRPSWWEPKQPSSWWEKTWDDYVEGWKRCPGETMVEHAFWLIVVSAVLAVVGIAVTGAWRDWRDPCAEYVSVPEQTHTVDGTPVTVTVQKCLRMKEGRGR